MSDISYLAPGDSPTAERWNDFYSIADQRMRNRFSDMPPPLWVDLVPSPDTVLCEKRFYFFDGAIPALAVHPTNSLWTNYAANPIQGGSVATDPWLRNYDHAPFTALVAAAVLGTTAGDDRPQTDDALEIARVDMGYKVAGLVTAYWKGQLWPDTSATVIPPFSLLDLSLEAHKKTFAGTEYWLYDGNPAPSPTGSIHAEAMSYPRRWESVELIIGNGAAGTITLPDNYNRFNFFRISNLRASSVTVAFGAHHSVVVGAMRSKCVRRTAVDGAYTDGYSYFHKFLTGDPWFLNRQAGNPLMSPMVATMISEATTSPVTGFPAPTVETDASKLHSASDLYGSIFGDPTNNATMLGDLIIHKGDIAVVDPAGFPEKAQTTTVDAGVPHLLKELDGTTTARGVFARDIGSPIVLRGAVEIYQSTGGDLNWSVSGNDTIGYSITFHPRTTGATPMLNAGDSVDVTFWYENRRTLAFRGMATAVADLATVGVTLAVDGGVPYYLDISSSPDTDLLGLTSNFCAALFGRNYKALTAATSTITAFDELKLGLKSGWKLTVATAANSATWQPWVDNGDGTVSADGAPVDVTWDDHTYISGTTYSPTDPPTLFTTLGDLKTAVASAGVLTATLSFSLTAIGAVASTWRSLTPLYPGDFNFGGFMAFKFDSASGKLIEDRTIQIGGIDYPIAWPQFGTFGPSSFAFCTPRLVRRYCARRWVDIDHTTAAYAPNPVGDSTVPEPPFIKNFYETEPVGDDYAQETDILDATAFSLLYPFAEAGDWMPGFSDWWTNYGGTGNERLTYYGVNRGPISSDTKYTDLTNLLPLSVDSVNAAASVVNATVQTHANQRGLDPDVYGGVVPVSNSFGIGRKSYRPRESYFAWDDSINPGNTTIWTGLGFTVHDLLGLTGVTDLLDSVNTYYAQDWSAMPTISYIEWTSTAAYATDFATTFGAGGTGYTVGDILTVVGGRYGTKTDFVVTAVGGGGAVTAALVNTPGAYNAKPNHANNHVTGGTGTGCVIAFNMSENSPYPAPGEFTVGLLDCWKNWNQVSADDILNFRYVRISDVKTYVEARGCGFVFKELVVPAILSVNDGGSGGAYTVWRTPPNNSTDSVPIKAYGWTEDDSVNHTGEWCFDPDDEVVPGGGQPNRQIVRSDPQAVDVGVFAIGGGLVTVGWGTMSARMYDVGDITTLGPQLRKQNSRFIYRRYGSLPATAMVFGRYYADMAPISTSDIGTEARLTLGNPAIERTLMGSETFASIELTDNENFIDITTGALAVEQGELLVWENPRSLT